MDQRTWGPATWKLIQEIATSQQGKCDSQQISEILSSPDGFDIPGAPPTEAKVSIPTNHSPSIIMGENELTKENPDAST